MQMIDFETRSRVNLKVTGAYRYSEDPSTQVLCMVYSDGDDVRVWVPGDKIIDFKGIVAAHNAMFDRCIYENIMVKRHGFKSIPVERWRCSAAKAASHALPRGLADACGALALKMQKDSEGRAVMLKLAKPRKPTKNNASEWHNDPKDFERLYSYGKQDVRSQRELYERLPDLPPEEQKVWVLDQNINVRGVAVDLETVNAAIHLIEEYNTELTAELAELTDDIIGSADERDKILQWCAMNGLELDNLQKGSVVDTLKIDLPAHVKQPEKVRRVIEIRQQLAKTSTAKYFAIREAVCQDGCLRDLLMYHGASTGRWAGKGPQPQNLPRNTSIHDIETCITLIRRRNLAEFRLCYEDPMEALSVMLRAMFIARPGKILIGGDYAQIEARVLAWLAGDERALRLFEKGEDIYLALARLIYSRPDLTKADAVERQVGKSGELGAGFGMGHKRFREDTLQKTGIDLGAEMSKRVIDTYRQVHAPIVKFWYDQEAAAMEAVRRGTIVTCGKIKWKVTNVFLYCRLPSGRCLAYCHPKIQPVETPWGEMKDALTFMAVNPKTKNWERQSTYGGAIAENITQAVARDLMAGAMLKAEEADFSPCLTIHDELVCDVDLKIANSKKLKSIMEEIPEWAAGLPIKVEVWCDNRYVK